MNDILGQILSNPLVGAIGLALAIGAIALWLATAWWAYGDALRRTESSVAAFGAAGWIILSTPVFLPLALLAYRYARPQVAAADSRAERLAIALSRAGEGMTCPGCATVAQAGWVRCPACTTWLATPCAACGAWSDPAFEIFPLCGVEANGEPTVARAAVVPVGGGAVAVSAPAAFWPGHGMAAAGGSPAAAEVAGADAGQRGFRSVASSSRPRSYATSRDSLSAPS